ncbi:MAG: hypothetical protein ACLPUT_06605 [Solirubrobacteraceae bacterium]
MAKQLSSLEEAAKRIEGFGAGPALTARIKEFEAASSGLRPRQITKILARGDVGAELIAAARTIKALAGQVNVIMHAAGILASLPYILEPSEIVESLSLGAGNTGRDHDLVTDRRIAEFKFIDWRPASNTIRENVLFADVFGVASAETDKRRIVYVLGTEHPMKFLRGGRAISSVLSRSSKVRLGFYNRYGIDTFATVRDYWATVCDSVEVLDLRELVPQLFALGPSNA